MSGLGWKERVHGSVATDHRKARGIGSMWTYVAHAPGILEMFHLLSEGSLEAVGTVARCQQRYSSYVEWVLSSAVGSVCGDIDACLSWTSCVSGAACLVTMFLLSVSRAISVVQGSAPGLDEGSSVAGAKRLARAD